MQEESDQLLKTCPNCGHENNESDRFCANCGARLTPVAPPREEETEAPSTPPESTTVDLEPGPEVPAAPPSTIPPPVTPSFARPTNEWEQPGRETVDDDWKMSDLGPPPRNKRRTWLWIVVAILAFFVLACCGFLFWISATDAGSTWFNDLATQVSEQATEAAR